jgi:hypothetical protein
MGLLLYGGTEVQLFCSCIVSSTETTLHKIIHKDNEQHVGYATLLHYTEAYHVALLFIKRTTLM